MRRLEFCIELAVLRAPLIYNTGLIEVVLDGGGHEPCTIRLRESWSDCKMDRENDRTCSGRIASANIVIAYFAYFAFLVLIFFCVTFRLIDAFCFLLFTYYM